MANIVGIRNALERLDKRTDEYIVTLKRLRDNENPDGGIQSISTAEVETVERLIINAAVELTNAEPIEEVWIPSHRYCSANEMKYNNWTEQNLEYLRWFKFWIQKSFTYLEFLEGFNGKPS